jgi:diaminohydroxyphosphoribosylaminopyrimidine deaminase/5-amino-6-(5-phosphoribosylamino)uracil reductase
LVAAGLVDRVVAYVAPTTLGRDARPALDGPGPATLSDATRWQPISVTRLGEDVRLEYEVAR